MDLYPVWSAAVIVVGVGGWPERRFVPLFLTLTALTSWSDSGHDAGRDGVVKCANADVADRDIMTGSALQAFSGPALACIFVVLALLGAASSALRVASRSSGLPNQTQVIP